MSQYRRVAPRTTRRWTSIDTPTTALALPTFQGLAERFPDDPLVTLHLKRLSDGAHGDLIVMSEK